MKYFQFGRYETEMDVPLFSIVHRGSYRPSITLIIVNYILSNRKSECTVIIIVIIVMFPDYIYETALIYSR